jgi:hypothetical protein
VKNRWQKRIDALPTPRVKGAYFHNAFIINELLKMLDETREADKNVRSFRPPFRQLD